MANKIKDDSKACAADGPRPSHVLTFSIFCQTFVGQVVLLVPDTEYSLLLHGPDPVRIVYLRCDDQCDHSQSESVGGLHCLFLVYAFNRTSARSCRVRPASVKVSSSLVASMPSRSLAPIRYVLKICVIITMTIPSKVTKSQPSIVCFLCMD